MLVKSCALCAASNCVKCTTYTGLLRSLASRSRVWASVISEYANSSGTGRSIDETVTLGRPLRLVSSSSKNAVSPSVADINRNRHWGKLSNGTCHATPRSRSA